MPILEFDPNFKPDNNDNKENKGTSMAEDRTKAVVTKVDPAFLQQFLQKDTSLDNLREYRVLDRLTIVNDKVKSPELAAMGVGSAVLTPSMQKVAGLNEGFLFVPIFMYTEFCKWKDRLDESDLPKILEKSRDKKGKLAMLARDKDKRFEIYPGGKPAKPFVYYYAEHLNFCGLIYDNPNIGLTPVTISFFKGEFWTGKGFSTKIMGRRIEGQPAPLWMQVWRMAVVDTHTDGKGHTWCGLDISNPMENPFIQQKEFEQFYKEHETLKKLYDTNSLDVDMTAGDVDAEVVNATDAEAAASAEAKGM